MAADASSEDKPKAALLPDYPSERPDKKTFDAWFDKASTVLTQHGYGSLVRGEVPYELRKLAQRPLLLAPADPSLAAEVTAKELGRGQPDGSDVDSASTLSAVWTK